MGTEIEKNLEVKASEEPGYAPQHMDTAETPDPWTAAFAAMESIDSGNAGDDPTDGTETEPNSTDGTAGATGRDGALDAGDTGGQPPADTEGEPEFDYAGFVGAQSEQMKAAAIKEVAEYMVSKGIRNQQGRLGATINDPDIYKRAEDGTVSFINPDTGKPFTGDNPRAQAKQWVDQYNEELKETFDRMARSRHSELMETQKPVNELMAFAPVYEKLDPVRRDMLDALIEDYEVHDADGQAIGYSCDLNAALAQVNRQITKIRESQTKVEPSAPEVAMKTGTGQSEIGGAPEFKSLAEAMEWEQNNQLSKLSGRK